jgi:hypothetical protein
MEDMEDGIYDAQIVQGNLLPVRLAGYEALFD